MNAQNTSIARLDVGESYSLQAKLFDTGHQKSSLNKSFSELWHEDLNLRRTQESKLANDLTVVSGKQSGKCCGYISGGI